tara:strand:+ start:17775 stop:17975 length:201 start_codon:yes stop_codon:yes gene_type:complete
MENHDFNDFFESYLDIDSWADELIEKQNAIQSRRKNRLSEKKEKRKMENIKNNNKFFTRKKNGKKT